MVVAVVVGVAVLAGLRGGAVASAESGQGGEGSWTGTDGPKPGSTLHAAVRLDDGRVLATGGVSSESGLRKAELYDPDKEDPQTGEKGVWENTDPMNQGRYRHEMVKLPDGRVLVTGPPVLGNLAPVPELYDPKAAEGERWTELPQPPVTNRTAAVVLDAPACAQEPPEWCGNVFVVGYNGTTATPAAAMYDPQAGPRGAWTPAAAPEEVYGSLVRLEGTPCDTTPAPQWCGTILGAKEGTAQVFTPGHEGRATDRVGEWHSTDSLNVSTQFHTLTSLPDGRVLAVGGFASGSPTSRAEIYEPAEDPAHGAWTKTGALDAPRVSHTAVLLNEKDGTVLVAGGHDNSTDCGHLSAEIFNPERDDDDPDNAKGAFVSAGDMTRARYEHTATRLVDGRVLVAGAWDGPCGNDTAEVYTPSSLQEAQDAPEVDSVSPDKALTEGGLRVTISGSHFAQVENVFFGGTPAESFEVQGAAKITAIVPSRQQPGTVPVRVETAGGRSEAENPRAAFTYVEPAGVWTSAGALPTTPGREGVEAAPVRGGQVLMAYTDNGGSPQAARYDAGSGQVHHDVAAPPLEVELLAPLADGRALVMGEDMTGSTVVNETPASAVYNPEDRSWEPTTTPPVFQPEHGAGGAVLLLDGRALVVGQSAGGQTDQSQVYEPKTGRWRLTNEQPASHPLAGSTLTVMGNGDVLLAGGGSSNIFSRSRSAQLFDPDTEQWRVVTGMRNPHAHHAAAGVGTEKLLLAGGYGLYTPPGEEVFDAGANTDARQGVWHQVGELAHPRIDHTLTRLADGSGLAVGGQAVSSENQSLTHVERFRPTDSQWKDGEWQPTAPLENARSLHAAVALETECGSRCGNVLAVGGGSSEWFEATKSVELYTPRPQVTGVAPASGVAGTEVTIRGYGFAGVDEVTIRGTSVEFTVARTPGTPEAPAEITATVPSGLSVGEAPVTVTNEVPTTDGAAKALTSQASPQAVFTVIEPGTADNTGGDNTGGDVGGEDAATGGENGDSTGGAGEEGQSALPGLVDDLAANALSASEVKLTWTAVGDGSGASAPGYVVKQSREPIASEADFADAFVLCGGVCEPNPVPKVGGDLSLTVLDLDPGTTYHYAVRARSESGELGPVSDSVSVTTLGGGPGGAGSQDGTEPSGDGSEPAGSELIRSVCGEDTPRASFTDRETVPEAHRLSVDCAAAQGVVAGFADGSFRPALGLRRDQMASFIARALQAADVALPEPGEQRFVDVAAGSAHADAIHRLAAAGIVAGGPGQLSADRYGPGQVIRRDQMAAFLIRAGEYATGQQLASGGGGGRFSDVPAGNVHAAQVDAAAALELAQGYPDGTYRPGQQVRRDQMATFITRLLGSLNQGTLADSNQ